MLVTVTIEEQPDRKPTIIVSADGEATVRVALIRRVGDVEDRTEFEAVLPDSRAYPPLIP